LDVLGVDVLEDAKRRHGDLSKSLDMWRSIATRATWKNLLEVRQTWRDTDAVAGKTIFNIKGNSYRLITTINYQTQVLVVEKVLTHAEYSKG
jgi:mRNA interferase HigB